MAKRGSSLTRKRSKRAFTSTREKVPDKAKLGHSSSCIIISHDTDIDTRLQKLMPRKVVKCLANEYKNQGTHAGDLRRWVFESLRRSCLCWVGGRCGFRRGVGLDGVFAWMFGRVRSIFPRDLP
ncbi:unnamed protein product [Dovyalis caffra]|uniref:Uncharacterized protein n=1 Tax=Dovyalis caffra TaxID=77055 RepID=A0AAV1RIF8_9ROSI|nr:unnamed protein product [Dovyalis caffra]